MLVEHDEWRREIKILEMFLERASNDFRYVRDACHVV